MEFDDAKENIQPLATGRNASILQASISYSPQELLEKRREFEAGIHAYSGDDPLEPWYNYISWIEQSFPSGGKESGLMQVLSKCLRRFESEERYYQDRRMIKLFIKFLDSHKDSTECYQQLYNAGIGTMVADFYIAWAYCNDSIGQTRKADEVFRRGIECRAQPLDELKEAHQHFGFSVAQRTIYKDDKDALISTNRQIEERRSALSSLRAHRGRTGKGEVGSIRTGVAIKSLKPGTVQHDSNQSSSSSSNARIPVLADENINPNMNTDTMEPEEVENEQSVGVQSATVVRSIVDKARHQENEREPGPWNKVHDKKNAKKLIRQKKTVHDLGFSIHEDKDNDNEISMEIIDETDKIIIPESERNYDKPFRYPLNFVSKNRTQPEWILPITTECKPDPNTLPRYNKCMIYPRPNREFQNEELQGYFYFKRLGIQNAFTERYKGIWGNDITVPIRLYPNFARESKQQTLNELDTFFVPPKDKGSCMVPLEKIYDIEKQEEFQNEELMSYRLPSVGNETVLAVEDMDETVCMSSNNEQVQRRKSFFPTRRSLAIRSVITEKIGSNETFESKTNLVSIAESQLEANNEKSFLPAVSAKEKVENSAPLVTNDESAVHKQDAIHTAPSNADFDDFQFKTPALPTKSTKQSPEIQNTEVQSTNKLPFEIYVEEETEAVSPGIFDAEETCSTQIFNNFIKSQSVSTPKTIQKVQKRQFGGVLLDKQPNPVPPVETQPTEAVIQSTDFNTVENEPMSNSPGSPDMQVDGPVNTYSLIRKQLSTILETSEHGTTQATYATGTSTKSSNGSQESDCADAASNAMPPHITHNHNTNKDISCHSTKDVVELMRDVHLNTAAVAITEKSIVLPLHDTPPSAVASPAGKNTFSIYLDETETLPQLPKAPLGDVAVGNFEHMIQREDTATHCLAVHPTVRFQEDKTETVTKLIVPPVFPDDRTDTIPKVQVSLFTFEHAPNATALQERTETTQKQPNIAKQTSTIPNLPATAMENLHLDDNTDDSFEFFRKSPSKVSKIGTKINLFSLQRDTDPTPVKAAGAKRLCVQQTPTEIVFKKSSAEKNSPMDFMKFFENDMMNFDDGGNKNATGYTQPNSEYAVDCVQKQISSHAHNKANDFTFKAKTHTNIAGNSFMLDYSLTGQTPAKNRQEVVKSSKILMGNSQTDEQRNAKDVSFLPEFSFIPETQPYEPSNKSSIQNNISGETQQPNTVGMSKPKQDILSSNKKETKDRITSAHKGILELQDSFLPNFSYIEETQPTTERSFKSQTKPSCTQETVKRTSVSHIPKRMTTKCTLIESKLTTESSKALKLKQAVSEKSVSAFNIADDISFIPETQEIPTNISQTKTNNFTQNTLSTAPENKRSCSASISSETSQLTANAKRSITLKSNETRNTLEKSNTAYADGNSNREPIFELNAETEMFSTGLSMIANSTMLTRSPFKASQAPTNFKIATKDQNLKAIAANKSSNKTRTPQKSSNSRTLLDEQEQDMSIYFKNTPRTPVLKIHNKSWSDSEDNEAERDYLHHEIDLNETNQRIYSICEDQHVNPFNADLLNALLDQIDFVNYLNDLKNTMLVGRVPRLSANSAFTVNNVAFSVSKLIGEGAYGIIYRGIEKKSGKEYAFKQERPPNYWEYYICLEVQSRISNEEILSAYMNIDYALIGNNASIFISPFSSYGSIISVCNRIKKNTLKNVDEYVVMHLTCELLQIIDHLHAIYIIHADVKADNFLLMKKLTYNSRPLSLQLIDFGVSIDMKNFKKNQTFTYVHNDNAFKCVEMREDRPWTYQLDLYGLAGVIHVMLFGKYMEIEKRADKGIWLPTTHMPRYINKVLWESIFRTLLNVRDCKSMPNLQELRSKIKEEMAEKERYVISKIAEFNKALGE